MPLGTTQHATFQSGRSNYVYLRYIRKLFSKRTKQWLCRQQKSCCIDNYCILHSIMPLQFDMNYETPRSIAYISFFVLTIAMLMYFENIYSNTKQKKTIIITICVNVSIWGDFNISWSSIFFVKNIVFYVFSLGQRYWSSKIR